VNAMVTWTDLRATLRAKEICDTKEPNQSIKDLATQVDLTTFTKAKLMSICERKGLSTSGTKADLVNRLTE
jgi:hypothetical protein